MPLHRLKQTEVTANGIQALACLYLGSLTQSSGRNRPRLGPTLKLPCNTHRHAGDSLRLCSLGLNVGLRETLLQSTAAEMAIADPRMANKSNFMSHATLRMATVEDVDLILELIQALAHFENLSDQVEATREQLQQCLFGAHPAAEVILVFEGAASAGFAVFHPNFSTFLGKPGLHLEDLYVRPEFRGRGHGRSLLQRLAQLAVERGYGRFEWTVLDWNASAIGFYRRQGAEILPEWRICRVTGEALDQLAHSSSRKALN